MLIWEECHSESTLCSVSPSTSGTENLVLPFRERVGCLGSEVHSSLFGVHEGDRLRPLINKMMANNQVIIVGEGYVFLLFHVPYDLVSHFHCLLHFPIESLIFNFAELSAGLLLQETMSGFLQTIAVKMPIPQKYANIILSSSAVA